MARPKSKNQPIRNISSAKQTTPKPVEVIPQVAQNELPEWAKEPDGTFTASTSGSISIGDLPPVGSQTIIIPAQNPSPLPPMVNVQPPQNNNPVFDDQYLVNVDYITTPGGVPIVAERITRSELYQAGLNVEYLLEVEAITFFTRVEVQSVKG